MQPSHLQYLRKSLEHTQESLAAALGIGVATVQRWEQGVYPTPDWLDGWFQGQASTNATRYCIVRKQPEGSREPDYMGACGVYGDIYMSVEDAYAAGTAELGYRCLVVFDGVGGEHAINYLMLIADVKI